MTTTRTNNGAETMTSSKPKAIDHSLYQALAAAKIQALRAEGLTLEAAFDATFGPGKYRQLLTDTYNACREAKK
jgi:hypothetical protein